MKKFFLLPAIGIILIQASPLLSSFGIKANMMIEHSLTMRSLGRGMVCSDPPTAMLPPPWLQTIEMKALFVDWHIRKEDIRRSLPSCICLILVFVLRSHLPVKKQAKTAGASRSPKHRLVCQSVEVRKAIKE